MKKRLIRKLALNKEIIASLNPDEMDKIKGAVSLLFACTESCSNLVACCEPKKDELNQVKDLG